MNPEGMPSVQDLFWPTLTVLRRHGSLATANLWLRVGDELQLPQRVMDTPHNDGPKREVYYRVCWACTKHKWIGSVDNPQRGRWEITPYGRRIRSEAHLRDLIPEVPLSLNPSRSPSPTTRR